MFNDKNRKLLQRIILTIAIFFVYIITIASFPAYFFSLNRWNKYKRIAVQPTASPTVTPVATIAPLPTPITDISDWRTYKNDKYGYEIKYPKDWQIIYLKDLYPGNTSIALRSPEYEPIKDGNVTHVGEIYIDNIDNSNNLSIKDLFATFNDTSVFWFEKFTHKDIIIKGNRGVLFNNIEENKIKRMVAYIQGEKKVIGVSYLFLENPNRDIFDKILFTFKFTEPVGDSSSWKTYNNEKFGYTVKYPLSWFTYDDYYNGEKHPENLYIQNFSRPAEGGFSGIGGTGCQLSVRTEKDKYTSIQEWINAQKNNLGKDFEKVNTKETELGGIKGLTATFFGSFLGSGEPAIIILNNGVIYKIIQSWQDFPQKYCQLVFDKILLSFKFNRP